MREGEEPKQSYMESFPEQSEKFQPLLQGLPKHALVAEHHTGVGIFKQEIVAWNLPIPKRDMLAQTIEEEIISWADLFFSKNPKRLMQERIIEEAYKTIEGFGAEYRKIFRDWESRFA